MINPESFSKQECFEFVCWHVIDAYIRIYDAAFDLDNLSKDDENIIASNEHELLRYLSPSAFYTYYLQFSFCLKNSLNFIFRVRLPEKTIFHICIKDNSYFRFKDNASLSFYKKNDEIYLFLMKNDESFKRTFLTYYDIFNLF